MGHTDTSVGGLAYLAGAVDGVESLAARDWREEAAGELAERGWSSYSPPHAFKIGTMLEGVAEAVIATNDFAMQQSAVLVVNASGRSWGTPLECEAARVAQKPVFVFGGAEGSVYQYSYRCWVATLDDLWPFFDEWLISCQTALFR